MQCRLGLFIPLAAMLVVGEALPVAAREYRIRVTEDRVDVLVIVGGEKSGSALAEAILQPGFRSPAFNYGTADRTDLKQGDALIINYPEDLLAAEKRKFQGIGALLPFVLQDKPLRAPEAAVPMDTGAGTSIAAQDMASLDTVQGALRDALRPMQLFAVAIIIGQCIIAVVLWRRLATLRSPTPRPSVSDGLLSSLTAAVADLRKVAGGLSRPGTQSQPNRPAAHFFRAQRHRRYTALDAAPPLVTPKAFADVEDSDASIAAIEIQEPTIKPESNCVDDATTPTERLLLKAWADAANEDREARLGARYTGRFLGIAGINASDYARDGLTFRARRSDAKIAAFLFLESERFIAIRSDVSPEYLVYPAKRELDEMQDYVGVFSKLFRYPGEAIAGAIRNVVSAARLPAEIVRTEVKGPHNSIGAVGNQYIRRGEVELE